jgi:hypothetical protein
MQEKQQTQSTKLSRVGSPHKSTILLLYLFSSNSLLKYKLKNFVYTSDRSILKRKKNNKK